MATDDEHPELSGARLWGRRRRALDAARDSVVLACLKARVSKEDIHQAMGLGRSTIDRIEARYARTKGSA